MRHLSSLSFFNSLHETAVCPSVKRMDCDKTEDHLAQFFLVFWEEEWLVGATPSTWNFGSLERNRRFWTDILSYIAHQP